MDIHVCKQCGSRFVYCRACVFRPIRYKDAGFCSKECYEASKIKVIPKIETEEVIIEDIKPIEEEVAVEVEAEAIASAETITMAESTVEKETYNTYKKKKNKYREYTSSL